MVAGDIACPAILVIDQPAELGAAGPQCARIIQRLCLGIGEREQLLVRSRCPHPPAASPSLIIVADCLSPSQ